MLREEAIDYLKHIKENYHWCCEEDALEMAIKVLEQEPKTDLDKMRAEMAELIEWHDCPIELDGGNDAWYCEAVNRCIEIIDKYRQEDK